MTMETSRNDLIDRMLPLEPSQSVQALVLLAEFDKIEDKTNTNPAVKRAFQYAEAMGEIALEIGKDMRGDDDFVSQQIRHMLGSSIKLYPSDQLGV